MTTNKRECERAPFLYDSDDQKQGGDTREVICSVLLTENKRERERGAFVDNLNNQRQAGMLEWYIFHGSDDQKEQMREGRIFLYL